MNTKNTPNTDLWKKIFFGFCGVLLALNTWQLATFGGIVNSVDKYNRGVVDELGKIRGDVITFAGDLNEIRQFLLLPTKQYSFSENEGDLNTQEEQKSSDTEVAIYTFLSSLNKDKQEAKNRADAEKFALELTTDQTFTKSLSAEGLKFEASTNDDASIMTKVLDTDNEPLYNLILEKNTNLLRAQSILGTKDFAAYPKSDVKPELLGYLKDNKLQIKELRKQIKQLQSQLDPILQDTEITAALAAKKVNFTLPPEENAQAISYKIILNDLELLKLSISKKDLNFSLNGQTFSQGNDLKSSLLQAINQIDTSSPEEKLINQRKQELQTVFSQQAFTDLLDANQLKVETTPREENNKLVYDVKTPEQKVQFSFAIELSSGLLKIIKDDQEIDLSSLLNADGSKKKS